MFLEKFVEKYRHKLPEVVEAYQGKLRFQGFSFELKMWVVVVIWANDLGRAI